MMRDTFMIVTPNKPWFISRDSDLIRSVAERGRVCWWLTATCAQEFGLKCGRSMPVAWRWCGDASERQAIEKRLQNRSETRNGADSWRKRWVNHLEHLPAHHQNKRTM